MDEIRLLTLEDIHQLDEILAHYKQNELAHPNPIYLTDNLLNHADWIRRQFLVCPANIFKIAGKFVNNELVQISVGYSIALTWHRNDGNELLPYWSVGLLYFKYRSWKSPAVPFQALACVINSAFEQDGYTKFYTVQKLQNRMLREKNVNDYFSNGKFFKTLLFLRYSVQVEHIFNTQADIDNYPFRLIKQLLPRAILRPIVLISATINILGRDTNSNS
jgi:hypothetical protein